MGTMVSQAPLEVVASCHYRQGTPRTCALCYTLFFPCASAEREPSKKSRGCLTEQQAPTTCAHRRGSSEIHAQRVHTAFPSNEKNCGAPKRGNEEADSEVTKLGRGGVERVHPGAEKRRTAGREGELFQNSRASAAIGIRKSKKQKKTDSRENEICLFKNVSILVRSNIFQRIQTR